MIASLRRTLGNSLRKVSSCFKQVGWEWCLLFCWQHPEEVELRNVASSMPVLRRLLASWWLPKSFFGLSTIWRPCSLMYCFSLKAAHLFCIFHSFRTIQGSSSCQVCPRKRQLNPYSPDLNQSSGYRCCKNRTNYQTWYNPDAKTCNPASTPITSMFF